MYAEWIELELGDDIVARVWVFCTPDAERKEKEERAKEKLERGLHDWSAKEILEREG